MTGHPALAEAGTAFRREEMSVAVGELCPGVELGLAAGSQAGVRMVCLPQCDFLIKHPDL